MDLFLLFKIVELLFLTIIIYLLFRPIINGAIYFPTKLKKIEFIKDLAGVKPGERIVDLGSGDGRILARFAKEGVEAHGYEINPLLVWRSRRILKRAGLYGQAVVHWQSFWQADLSQYNVVVVYGIPYIMKRLERKLKYELKPGAKVISNVYEFSDWQPAHKENNVYLYIKS